MNHYAVLFDLIGDLARKRFHAAEQTFGTIGLGHSEARLLNLLGQLGGSASQTTLSTRMVLDRTNTGRALARLEQSGDIERIPSPVDKRSNDIALTDKGRITLQTIADLRQEIIASFFGDLTTSEAATAIRLLRKAIPEVSHE